MKSQIQGIATMKCIFSSSFHCTQPLNISVIKINQSRNTITKHMHSKRDHIDFKPLFSLIATWSNRPEFYHEEMGDTLVKWCLIPLFGGWLYKFIYYSIYRERLKTYIISFCKHLFLITNPLIQVPACSYNDYCTVFVSIIYKQFWSS